MKLACLLVLVESTDPGAHVAMIRFRVWIDGKLAPNCINRQSGTINGYLGAELTIY